MKGLGEEEVIQVKGALEAGSSGCQLQTRSFLTTVLSMFKDKMGFLDRTDVWDLAAVRVAASK
jgi:hypothetical protein